MAPRKDGSLPAYTWQDVAKHNKEDSAWVIVDDGVYDITGAVRFVVSRGRRAVALPLSLLSDVQIGWTSILVERRCCCLQQGVT